VPPENREPFFEPSEWKALAVFRPREWLGWWRTEPLFSKVVAVALVALGAYALYSVTRGDARTGWFLVATVAGLALILFVLAPLFYVIVAALRWVLRSVGVASWWRRVRKDVLAFGRFLFWVGVAALVLVGLWPYLSLDPVRSWYALTGKVSVEQVEMAKKPHDCEFMTAPIGVKHCHYAATAVILTGTDAPDGKRAVVVTYERVEE
jgi:hypothetical protein